jgi:hypothetical protein
MKKIFYFACLLMPALCMAQNTTTTTQQTTTTPGGATINMNINGMPATTTQQTTITTTTTTTSTDAGAATQTQVAAPAASGCVSPMAHDDYESAKTSITAKDFEDTKLTLAKQIAGSNCMSAEQIRGIMKLFSFENSKLDFAKFAYSHCCDKSNYYKVNDAFDFDSSSKDLNTYISSH